MQVQPSKYAFMNITSGALRNPFLREDDPYPLNTGTLYLRWLMSQSSLMDVVAGLLREDAVPHAEERDLVEAFRDGTLPAPPDQPPIFVFGSNLAGRHGKGAAEYAHKMHGAQFGVGRGRTGNAWAIPTKDEQLRSLPMDAVLAEIQQFMDAAGADSSGRYVFTRVGCGLAGLEEAPIRDFCLANRPENVQLPGLWLRHERPDCIRVVVTGSRDFDDRSRLFSAMDEIVARLGAIEVVSGGGPGADRLGEDYAVFHKIPFKRFPARWDVLGNQAGFWRNHQMAWYGTHLLAFQRNNSQGTGQMIRAAEDAGLQVAAFRA